MVSSCYLLILKQGSYNDFMSRMLTLQFYKIVEYLGMICLAHILLGIFLVLMVLVSFMCISCFLWSYHVIVYRVMNKIYHVHLFKFYFALDFPNELPFIK